MKTLPLYAGLDVHQEFTVGTIFDEGSNAVRELKVPTNPKEYTIRLKRKSLLPIHLRVIRCGSDSQYSRQAK
jgi:hypothetical protein